MEFIKVTKENIAEEHICCAISNNDDCQVAAKKEWLSQRFDDGLVFLKANVRGKCFIEYLPAEKAWMPLDAPNYMVIDCLWVSGRFKGQGYSNQLLNACLEESKAMGKAGLVALSSKKKRGFLADPKYLRYKGFLPADTADPDFELMYLPFAKDAVQPRFKDCIKNPALAENGFVLFYSGQCPFTAKYVPLIQEIAASKGVPFTVHLLKTAAEAQQVPSPATSYSLFYDGAFVTHEILSEGKFRKLLTAKGFDL